MRGGACVIAADTILRDLAVALHRPSGRAGSGLRCMSRCTSGGRFGSLAAISRTDLACVRAACWLVLPGEGRRELAARKESADKKGERW